MRVHELKDSHGMSHDTVFHCLRIESCRRCLGWFYDLWFLHVFAAAYDAAPSQIIKDATRAMRLEFFCEDRMALGFRPRRKMPKLDE